MSKQLTYDSAPANTSTVVLQRAENVLLNTVEPPELVEIFLANPPLGFRSLEVRSGKSQTPAFLADFDLLTTLESESKGLREFLGKIPFAKQLLTFPTVFVGTTATEYSNYPDFNDYRQLIPFLIRELQKQKAQLLVFKDIPQESPLLSVNENEKAEMLFRQCVEAGFIPVSGQALAYVPIDFKSIDEYFLRLSKSRRKEFRKKLKESSAIVVQELSCGDRQFFDESMLETMYTMYKNVFAQSEIHFDLLALSFFRSMLQDSKSAGKVFCYMLDGEMIGYNICFLHAKRLVDKYVGFVYPQARQANLYFLSWFYNLDYALKHKLDFYIAGWTDPAVKQSLGAKFTLTRHAVYVRNPLLRAILRPFRHLFEADSRWLQKQTVGSGIDA